MMSSRSVIGRFDALLVIVAALAPPLACGAPIYDSTINTGSTAYAVTGSTVSAFQNCFTIYGCMGKAGQVWDHPDPGSTAAPVSTIPVTIPYSFSLTPAEKAAIIGAPAGTIGQFIVTASRDIGIRQGSNPDPDFIPTSLEGTSIGTLFQSITSTCPPGERGTAYPSDLVCGPNYHTDITATDVLDIPLAVLISTAADGKFDFALAPSPTIGRLNIFSVQLKVGQVPEPATLALLGVGLAGLGFSRRRTLH